MRHPLQPFYHIKNCNGNTVSSEIPLSTLSPVSTTSNVTAISNLTYIEEWVENYEQEKKSGALVRQRTIPTERPPLVGEVSANFSG
jgi:hypothetical protein